MGRAQFDTADFVEAARAVAARNGPAAVTVASVTAHLNAPTGSFYHRFASRDALAGELWLATVLAFQKGFIAAIDAGDGLAAALHIPAWSRTHGDDARLLLLYHRNDFIQGEWPRALKQGVAEQARQFEACIAKFARDAFGGRRADNLRRAQFVLADVPLAAVRSHLQKREAPPSLVDELIRTTYRAIVGRRVSAR
jgi:AcrR family transcriptional regulator